MDIKYISLNTIDISSFELIREKISSYKNQDHSRWVFKDPKTNLYYKIWNETYIRKNNILSGVLSNFYDKTTCPALYGLIFWEGTCRGYIMYECEDYDTIDNSFYSIIKEKTYETQYFAYDFCPQHIKKYNGQLTLIDLEGIYHLDYYESKSKEHQTLQIPGKFVEYEPYKHYIESILHTPLSEEEFLQLPLQQGKGGKEIILQDYTLKTVKDVVNFFKDPLSKFLFSIFIINAYFFSALSISEVFEDYIKNDKIKNVANRLLYVSAVVIPLITIILISLL